jgi:hypothetical protein
LGTRTWWYEQCPKCPQEIEVFDAPSSLMWAKQCGNCLWSDGLDYYEISDSEIVKCTKAEYKKMVKDGKVDPEYVVKF